MENACIWKFYLYRLNAQRIVIQPLEIRCRMSCAIVLNVHGCLILQVMQYYVSFVSGHLQMNRILIRLVLMDIMCMVRRHVVMIIMSHGAARRQF